MDLATLKVINKFAQHQKAFRGLTTDLRQVAISMHHMRTTMEDMKVTLAAICIALSINPMEEQQDNIAQTCFFANQPLKEESSSKASSLMIPKGIQKPTQEKPKVMVQSIPRGEKLPIRSRSKKKKLTMLEGLKERSILRPPPNSSQILKSLEQSERGIAHRDEARSNSMSNFLPPRENDATNFFRLYYVPRQKKS